MRRKINRRIKKLRIVSIDDCKRYQMPINDDGYYMRDDSFRIINIDGKPFFVRQEVARCVGFWYFDATTRSLNRYWENVDPSNEDCFVKFSEHAPKNCELAIDSADVTIAAVKYMMDTNSRFGVHKPYQDFLDFIQNVALPDFYSSHNALKIFDNAEIIGTNHIRAIMIDDEPWFVAADICKALEHTNGISQLDDDEKTKIDLGATNGVVDTLTNSEGISDAVSGVNQIVNCVNEYGLYRLILNSRKKEAKQFQRWLIHEVLPTLYRTGTYTFVKCLKTGGEVSE